MLGEQQVRQARSSSQGTYSIIISTIITTAIIIIIIIVFVPG